MLKDKIDEKQYLIKKQSELESSKQTRDESYALGL
jgi:hypothetical protein